MAGKRQRGGPAEWPFDIQRTKIIKDGRCGVAQIRKSTRSHLVTIFSLQGPCAAYAERLLPYDDLAAFSSCIQCLCSRLSSQVRPV